MDLSKLGVSKVGDFTVEVVDPVADYLELLEVGLTIVYVQMLCSLNNAPRRLVSIYICAGFRFAYSHVQLLLDAFLQDTSYGFKSKRSIQ